MASYGIDDQKSAFEEYDRLLEKKELSTHVSSRVRVRTPLSTAHRQQLDGQLNDAATILVLHDLQEVNWIFDTKTITGKF